MNNASILSINGGSSSLKCTLFDVAGDDVEPRLNFNVQSISGGMDGFVECLHDVLEQIRQEDDLGQLLAIGHRVVHGGDHFSGPVLVDSDVLAQLHQLSSLAPLHQPVNLKLIDACGLEIPGVPQIACFDTAFHQHMPDVARNYALPPALTESGIRGYGFHGISYDFIWKQLRTLDRDAGNKRIIIAHLGAGASACAIKHSQSIATTMGFSTADGLPMATRTGRLDPGVLVHLIREHGMSADDLERLIYKEGGMLALSGISGDMRELRASSDPRARSAIDHFVYSLVREIGSLIAALGGLDVLVFTGGIGENDVSIRSEVAQAMSWCRIELDDDANKNAASLVSTVTSAVEVRVISTDEEAMIANQTLSMVT